MSSVVPPHTPRQCQGDGETSNKIELCMLTGDFSCSRVGHGCVAAAVKSAGAVLAAAAKPGGCA